MTRIFPLGIGAAAVLCASGASAQLGDPYITISVANANGSGSLVVDLTDPRIVAQPNGGVVYLSSLPFAPGFPLPIEDQFGNTIATLTTLIAPGRLDSTATPFITDAQLAIALVLDAGDLDTDVTVTSTFAQTAPIANASIDAFAGFSVSDQGGAPGVFLSDPVSTFVYNGDMNTGTQFTQFTPASLSAGPIGTDTVDNTTGFTGVGVTVNSLQFSSSFTVSAGDQAAANYRMDVVPAPASIACLALGGLAAARRRR